MKQTKTITETMRVVDDDGNIIKTGDPETDAVSETAERTLIKFSNETPFLVKMLSP